MLLVTNDSSGLFLLPLSSMIASSVWDVLNGLGILFIPFIIMFVSCFAEARAQGLDEGSPAVLAVKSVEKAFWPMIFVIVVVVMPINNDLDVKYRQFSCLDNPSITSNNLNDIESASGDVLTALGFTGNSPSLFTGIVHTVSTGVNSALIAGMSCSKGASKKEVSQFISNMVPENESVYRSIIAFENQCHAIGIADARNALSLQKTLSANSDNLNGWNFHKPPFDPDADLMFSAYNGTLIVGESSNGISIKTPDTWFDVSQRNKTLECNTAGEALYTQLETDVKSQNDYQNNLTKALDYIKLFNTNVTQAEVEYDLVMTMYNSAFRESVDGSEIMWKAEPESGSYWSGALAFMGVNPATITKLNTMVDQVSENDSFYEDFSVSQDITNFLVTMGAVGTNIIESTKSHAVSLIGPLLVIIIQTILIGTLPLLTVLSKYSGKFLYNWVLLYFSVSMTPFWLNIATHLESILLSATDYSDSLITHVTSIQAGHEMQMYLVSSTAAMFIYIIPVIWVMLVQMIGNIAASAFMTSVAGAAVVGQAGGEMALNTAQRGANEGMNALGGNKNQSQSSDERSTFSVEGVDTTNPDNNNYSNRLL